MLLEYATDVGGLVQGSKALQETQGSFSKLFKQKMLARQLQLFWIWQSNQATKRSPLLDHSSSIVFLEVLCTELYSDALYILSMNYIGCFALVPALSLHTQETRSGRSPASPLVAC